MLKFALLGCGRIAKRHSELLGNKQIENAELVAVCDIDEQKSKKIGEQFGIPYYTDMHEMLNSIDIDVVTVLTESGYHAKHVLAITKYKKALLIKQDFIYALNNIANCFQRLRKYNEAKKYYLQAIKINPNVPILLDNYASVLKDMHNYHEAELYYKKAIRCDKTYVSAHYNLGLLYILQGEFLCGWTEYEWRLKKEDYIKFNSRFIKNIWIQEPIFLKQILFLQILFQWLIIIWKIWCMS